MKPILSKQHECYQQLALLALSSLLTLTLFANTSFAKSFPDCVLNSQGTARVCRNADPDSREISSSKFDLYLPAHPAQTDTFRPIFVIHGGCFTYGDKQDVASVAELFAQKGFAALAVNYTLANDRPGNEATSYPEIFDDLKRQLSWVESTKAFDMRIRTDWIGAYGESSGGTLASYLGTRHLNVARPISQSAVNSVVDFSGRIDFTRAQPAKEGTDCASKFLNASRATEMSRFKEASVQPQTEPRPAHFLIVHGSADSQVEPWHSEHLQSELRAVGVSDDESKLMILPGQGHGFEGASLTKALSATVSFFEKEAAQHNPGPTQIWIKRPAVTGGGKAKAP